MKKIVSFAIALLIVGTAAARTIHVPGDYTAIQTALDNAVSGDTVLVGDGTYTGADNINLDFGGQDIVLMSENGPDNTIIDCAYQTRGFYFHTGETNAAEVIGFTVTNGYEADGGGIHVIDAAPVFKNCIIRDCMTPTQGGGVYVALAAPTFIKCIIHNNFAAEGGGLSAEDSDVTINSCIIAANASSG